MSELSKAYEPGAVETRWYATWTDRGGVAGGDYRADPASPKPPFSIVIPPPNVTGVLTMGHVLNNTIQDMLARHARMTGHEVLWLPGTDHAGLATQTAVEKSLKKNEGITRSQLGREKFLERVWDWKEHHGGTIIRQLKRLGCSCDWSRERFTMDADYSAAVQQVFVALYDRGYIYRGHRMVNWCPGSLTAISDEEVIPTPQKSVLYTMRYEIVEEPGTYLEIATTRPETLMGDTAVAVNPTDPRYAAYIGKHCWRPFPKAPIPIVGDAHVDIAFGTGALKVTPAHDKADFEIGRRHDLKVVDVLHHDGRVHCPEVPELDGLDRFAARTRAAEMLKELGLLIKEEPYDNTVGFSERAGVPIEPRLSEQWFLRYPKAEEALRVVREGMIRFVPDHWVKVYEHWLENIQDWCISRQVWWGHRIPVWYRHRGTAQEELKCQVASPGEGWEQDPDTLDTWFSSWLWAYETMDATTRARFYPTDVLVTGPDIIFLWVARMIIAGLEFRPGTEASVERNLAFRRVYFTGLIRDKQGRKMSKSLGNSPDPIALMEKFGADGVRFGLLRIAPQGQDIRFDEKQIEEGRNFGNKLWNAARFRLMHGAVNPDPLTNMTAATGTVWCRDLLSKLARTVEAVSAGFADLRFSDINQRLYDFVWGDLCDAFIEAGKADLVPDANPVRREAVLAVMDVALHTVLRLLHPSMPHLTEELWRGMGWGDGEVSREKSVQFAPWPVALNEWKFPKETAQVEAVLNAMSEARTLRADCGLPSNRKLRWLFIPSPGYEWLIAETHVLASLLNAEQVECVAEQATDRQTPVCVTEVGQFFLPLAGVVEVEEIEKRLRAELAKTRQELEKAQKKVADPLFRDKVPAEVLAEHEARVTKFAARARQLEHRLKV
jgi:valyl-tRNA synthetase